MSTCADVSREQFQIAADVPCVIKSCTHPHAPARTHGRMDARTHGRTNARTRCLSRPRPPRPRARARRAHARTRAPGAASSSYTCHTCVYICIYVYIYICIYIYICYPPSRTYLLYGPLCESSWKALILLRYSAACVFALVAVLVSGL